MDTKHAREFRRQVCKVILRLYKLEGFLMWVAEKTQYNESPSTLDVDAFWDRYHMLHDELERLRRNPLWLAVDFEDALDEDAET